jgi:hypothetical protein
MIPQDRVNAVRPLGFTPRQAAFLVTVALHSGYCLRRQYATFAGVRYGKNVRAFLDRLVSSGLADRFVVRGDRGHVYHVHGRALYRAIGEEESRNRRPAGPAQIARKLMLLDAVIGRADGEWLATDHEKAAFFVDRMGVPAEALVTRRSQTVESPRASYFVHRLPIWVPAAGSPHLLYLAIDGSADPFRSFLYDHATLLRCLTTWTVVAVSTYPWPALRTVFDRFAQSLTSTQPVAFGELQWYFERRQLVDRGELAQVSVFDLRRYRELRQRFDSPAHEALYEEWLTTGRIGAATPGSPTGDSTGTLLQEALPFTYAQFGSLPGVA